MDQTVEITLTGHGLGTVSINGEKLDGVTELRMSTSAGGRNEITFTLIPNKFQISGIYDVSTIEDDSRKYCNAALSAGA